MNIISFCKYLPLRFAKAVANLPDELTEKAFEIRLRNGASSSVSIPMKNVAFNENGACKPENAMKATDDEMKRCLMLLCDCSLYSHEHTLKNGYIAIENGRAGVTGDTVTDSSGSIVSFKNIRAINLRVHKTQNGFAKKLISHYNAHGVGGTLIYAPPMLGKTTLLRSACFMLSNGIGIRPHRVGIVDERMEICLSDSAFGLADIITGCEKAKGIEMLTRTMSPEVIACDELSEKESKTVSEAQNTGVALLATAHAESFDMLMKRRFIFELAEKNIFVNFVRIKNGFEYDISNKE